MRVPIALGMRGAHPCAQVRVRGGGGDKGERRGWSWVRGGGGGGSGIDFCTCNARYAAPIPSAHRASCIAGSRRRKPSIFLRVLSSSLALHCSIHL
jgi:hypothetical protein